MKFSSTLGNPNLEIPDTLQELFSRYFNNGDFDFPLPFSRSTGFILYHNLLLVTQLNHFNAAV